jgi:hypothetical protein
MASIPSRFGNEPQEAWYPGHYLMRTQQGSLFKSHGAWYVRYREDGKKNPVAHRLASLVEYPKKSEVIPLKNEPISRAESSPPHSTAAGKVGMHSGEVWPQISTGSASRIKSSKKFSAMLT